MTPFFNNFLKLNFLLCSLCSWTTLVRAVQNIQLLKQLSLCGFEPQQMLLLKNWCHVITPIFPDLQNSASTQKPPVWSKLSSEYSKEDHLTSCSRLHFCPEFSGNGFLKKKKMRSEIKATKKKTHRHLWGPIAVKCSLCEWYWVKNRLWKYSSWLTHFPEEEEKTCLKVCSLKDSSSGQFLKLAFQENSCYLYHNFSQS